MPTQVETVGFCDQYYGTWTVPSDRQADVTYAVTLAGPRLAPFCTCPAFRYSGEPGSQTCKHIRRIWEHACLYNPQWHDPGPNDYAELGIALTPSALERTYPGTCPGCGGRLVAVRIAV